MAASERIGASFTIDVTDLKAGLAQANRLIKESQSAFKAAASEMDDWTKSEEGLQKKLESLNEIADIQKKKVEALQKEYDRLIDEGLDPTSAQAVNLRVKINEQQTALNNTKKEIEKYTDALDETGDELEEVQEQTEKTSGGFTVMKGALADLVADGFRIAIDAMKDFIGSCVDVGKNFDSAMSNVGAISGAAGEDLEKLREKAKEMGESTKFSASEAADAFGYMAMAGWKTEDMVDGIEGVLNLAAAAGADLGTTSDIVTDALTAMGYESKDAGKLADVMAAASSNANTNVEMMGQTFKYAAPLVGALGYNMEDTAVAIGLMANSGIKGEMAGTALRSIFTRLSSPTKDVKSAMDDLGVSLTDSEGNMKSFDEVMRDLRNGFADLSETEKTQYASTIAGQEAMSGLLAIVSAAPEDFDKLTKAVEESDGAAKKMAETMQDNLGGDLTKANSKLEGIKLTLYEKLEPAIRDCVQAFMDWADSVDWDDVAKTIEGVLDGIRKGFQWIIDNKDVLIAGLAGIATGFLAFKVASLIQGVTTALQGMSAAQAILNAVMAANPIGLIVAAIAGLVAAFVVLWNNCEDFRNFWIGLWDGIKAAFEPVINFIVQAFEWAWDAIQNVWNAVKPYFEMIWNNIKAVFEAVVSVLAGFFETAWNNIKIVWDTVVSYFQAIWDTIQGIFAVVQDVLAGDFSGAWEKIKEIVGVWGEFFAGVWDNIKKIFGNVIDFFKNTFSSAWKAIKNVFSNVGKFFGGIWDTIKEKFTSIGTKVGEAIGGAFKTAINAVLGTVEAVLNTPINAINGLIDVINMVPGISLGKLSTFNLPRLEKGGIVDRATTAVVGENGREAIIPLEKNKGWIKELAKEIAAENRQGVVVNQTNNYAQAHTRYEIYKSKQDTVAAVRLALQGGI